MCLVAFPEAFAESVQLVDAGELNAADRGVYIGQHRATADDNGGVLPPFRLAHGGAGETGAAFHSEIGKAAERTNVIEISRVRDAAFQRSHKFRGVEGPDAEIRYCATKPSSNEGGGSTSSVLYKNQATIGCKRCNTFDLACKTAIVKHDNRDGFRRNSARDVLRAGAERDAIHIAKPRCQSCSDRGVRDA